jgi:hypothetical protein
MAELVFYNPAAPKQQYRTIIPNDPNVPAGWLDSQGLDGAIPEAMKVFTAGINNQGAGAAPTQLPGYSDGDPQQRIDQPQGVNGILGGYGGGAMTQPSKWP